MIRAHQVPSHQTKMEETQDAQDTQHVAQHHPDVSAPLPTVKVAERSVTASAACIPLQTVRAEEH
jgi:hypothetical protein